MCEEVHGKQIRFLNSKSNVPRVRCHGSVFLGPERLADIYSRGMDKYMAVDGLGLTMNEIQGHSEGMCDTKRQYGLPLNHKHVTLLKDWALAIQCCPTKWNSLVKTYYCRAFMQSGTTALVGHQGFNG